MSKRPPIPPLWAFLGLLCCTATWSAPNDDRVETRARILAGIASENPDTTVTNIENLSCDQLLRAGISYERLGINKSNAIPVLQAIEARLESGECDHVGLKPDVVGDFQMSDDGTFCFECYSEYNRRAIEWLEELKATQARYEDMQNPSGSLETLGDFRVSSTGMLIHEECFAEERFSFDVEQAVVDALAQTFTKLIALEKLAVVNATGEPTAISRRHVPDFVELYDSKNWSSDADVAYSYRFGTGDEFASSASSTPCEDLAPMANHYGIDLGPDCSLADQMEKGRPKLFCELGEIEPIADHVSDGAHAHASNPKQPRPLIKTFEGRTRIYHQPYIVFNPQESRKFSSSRFQSALIHEHFHHFGWRDFSQDHNAYPYLCQAAIFYDSTHRDVLDVFDLEASSRRCIQSEYDLDSPVQAGRIRDAIATDYD